MNSAQDSRENSLDEDIVEPAFKKRRLDPSSSTRAQDTPHAQRSLPESHHLLSQSTTSVNSSAAHPVAVVQNGPQHHPVDATLLSLISQLQGAVADNMRSRAASDQIHLDREQELLALVSNLTRERDQARQDASEKDEKLKTISLDLWESENRCKKSKAELERQTRACKALELRLGEAKATKEQTEQRLKEVEMNREKETQARTALELRLKEAEVSKEQTDQRLKEVEVEMQRAEKKAAEVLKAQLGVTEGWKIAAEMVHQERELDRESHSTTLAGYSRRLASMKAEKEQSERKAKTERQNLSRTFQRKCQNLSEVLWRVFAEQRRANDDLTKALLHHFGSKAVQRDREDKAFASFVDNIAHQLMEGSKTKAPAKGVQDVVPLKVLTDWQYYIRREHEDMTKWLQKQRWDIFHGDPFAAFIQAL